MESRVKDWMIFSPMEVQVRQKASQIAVEISGDLQSVVSKSRRVRRVVSAFWATSEFGVRTALSQFETNCSQASEKRSSGDRRERKHSMQAVETRWQRFSLASDSQPHKP